MLRLLDRALSDLHEAISSCGPAAATDAANRCAKEARNSVRAVCKAAPMYAQRLGRLDMWWIDLDASFLALSQHARQTAMERCARTVQSRRAVVMRTGQSLQAEHDRTERMLHERLRAGHRFLRQP